MDNLSDPEATEPIMPNHLFILLNWMWFYPIRITFWEAEFSTWKTISNTDGNKKIRSKWNNVSSNSQVGDAVLVEDESCPWNLWLLHSKVGNVLLLVSQSGRKKFFSMTHPQISILTTQPFEDKTTTESVTDKKTSDTGARPDWNPELILHKIIGKRTLRTPSFPAK